MCTWPRSFVLFEGLNTLSPWEAIYPETKRRDGLYSPKWDSNRNLSLEPRSTALTIVCTLPRSFVLSEGLNTPRSWKAIYPENNQRRSAHDKKSETTGSCVRSEGNVCFFACNCRNSETSSSCSTLHSINKKITLALCEMKLKTISFMF